MNGARYTATVPLQNPAGDGALRNTREGSDQTWLGLAQGAEVALSRSGGQAGPDVVRDVVAPGVSLIALGEDRVGDAPVRPDRRVVPGQPVLIRVVVVVVDEIGEQDVGEGREAVCHPRWDVHALVDVTVEFDDLSGPIRAGADPQVVEDNADTAAQRIPVVGLVQVEVQADHGARLLLRAVPLNHLGPVGEPTAPVGLDEAATLVAVPL